MKKTTKLIIALVLSAMSAFAQIPNNDFEDWTINAGIDYPVGWTTCNSAGGPGYPVSKSTDHYPVGIGNYSIKMETNVSQIQASNCGHGFVKTALFLGDWGPAIPITGHPNSFCGYYKFIPQNNDTMMITLYLFQSGTIVASAILTNSSAAPNWTSFNIPISSYVSADSAEIGFSAFYGNYGQSPYGPWGNSVMYVDNISFDNLITSVDDLKNVGSNFSLFPNPASNYITLNMEQTITPNAYVNVYNVLGKLVSSERLIQRNQKIDVSNLNNGIYFVETRSSQSTFVQRLLIQR